MPDRWIQTYTGRKFWPLSPNAGDVCIEDIAHALSLKCRFGGHCVRFYSVAEHSILVSKLLAGTKHELWGLLHDATEAYLPDITRPIKASIPGFKTIETHVMAAISGKFSLLPYLPEPKAVKDADTALLYAERQQAMAEGPAWARFDGDIPQIKLQFWSPLKAEERFLYEFDRMYFTDRLSK